MSRNLIDRILDEFKDINYAYNDCSKYDTLKSMLNDAVEVVHGEWTTKRTWEHDGETYCSVCGHDGTVVWNYCPNCGAKMFASDINVVNKKGEER